jgi:small subunit ribosomal protein S13e
MGRMQSKGKGKGISQSALPYKRRNSRWVTHTPKTISSLIVTMAKKGMSPSAIGVTIRDKEAVPSIKLLTGQKMARLLKKNGTCLAYSRCRPLDPRGSLLFDQESRQHQEPLDPI